MSRQVLGKSIQMSFSHPELPFSWHHEADQHPHPLEEVEHISLLIP
ncbi:hypothetical protein OIU77_027960 [Salix suchowensis]|uniref:Uncharacterized protein n=1 Tax=Salix suchowensis TaxID=1278906 RepID=A0ABQ9BRG5_9ROSI|nr:hypothetical protein OIU78_014613 [Salix suchowensis]KAJ6389743.1 hypothetical protein OIU77_027960 [Salix suchowensis]